MGKLQTIRDELGVSPTKSRRAVPFQRLTWSPLQIHSSSSVRLWPSEIRMILFLYQRPFNWLLLFVRRIIQGMLVESAKASTMNFGGFVLATAAPAAEGMAAEIDIADVVQKLSDVQAKHRQKLHETIQRSYQELTALVVQLQQLQQQQEALSCEGVFCLLSTKWGKCVYRPHGPNISWLKLFQPSLSKIRGSRGGEAAGSGKGPAAQGRGATPTAAARGRRTSSATTAWTSETKAGLDMTSDIWVNICDI